MPKLDKMIQRYIALAKETYQAGWDDAAAEIMAAAKGRGNSQPKVALSPTPAGEERSNIDIVLQTIRDIPGLRGTEMIKMVIQGNLTANPKALARTCRTSLSRLNRRGLIEKRRNKWYPKEAH